MAYRYKVYLFSQDFRSRMARDLLFLLPLLMFFSSSAQSQSPQNYLDELKEEASDLKLDRGTRVIEQKASPVQNPIVDSRGQAAGNQAGPIEGMGAGLSKQEFEQFLKVNYIGSYLFYRRLDDQGQADVYQFYLETPSPEQVREKILEVHKQ